jgi:hypothetical protein
MLTFDGRIKILDFGVAFMFEREATTTQTGLFKGKLAYIAPEQIAGKGADRRSDVYSLAVVMHELLTGRRLFSKGKGALADATNRKRVPKPSTIVEDLPKELEDIVMKGLQLRQRARFTDTKEMAAALEAYLHSAGGESLESFAERELEEDREHHRGWLQAVMDAPSGSSVSTSPETKIVRPVSRTGRGGTGAGATAAEEDRSVEIPLGDSALVSFIPERPRRSGRLIGLMIIFAALTAGAWLLFPSKVEQNATRIANWATDEAKPMISDVLEDGAEAFDDPELDRTEQERIEEEDPETAEEVPEEEIAGDPVEEQEPDAPETATTGQTATTLVGERLPPPPVLIETPPIPKLVEPPQSKIEAPKPRPKAAPSRKKPVAKRAVAKRAKPSKPSHVQYGSLSIIARPGASILIDGKRVGSTPLNRARVRPGRHRVALVRGKEPKPRWQSTVWIREGRHVLIRLK